MKYAVKITRDTKTGVINIYPPQRIPNALEPYRLKYHQSHAEGLQIFATLQEAREAEANERFALTVAEQSAATQATWLKEAIERTGLSIHDLCALSDLSEATINAYVYGRLEPNPRYVAKLIIIANSFTELRTKARRTLPSDGGCGNPRKSRGGQPDIWMKQRRYRPSI